MGDRARIIFHDKTGVSPIVYLHWEGRRVPEHIENLAAYMSARRGDVAYAAARFVGMMHNEIPGDLSLGVDNCELTIAQSGVEANVRALSHGDAGVVVVDTRDFTWWAVGGYLEEHPQNRGYLPPDILAEA